MRHLKRLLLVAGRYRAENPYLEIGVKRLLEAKGITVTLALPGRQLSPAGFLDSVLDDPVFQAEQAVTIQGEWDFCKQMRGCEVVLFSTWRGYERLANLALKQGRLTLDFSAIVGLDHLPVGYDHCLVKSALTKRFLLSGHRVFGWREVKPDKIAITGSVLYEDPENMGSLDGMNIREVFCKAYELDPTRPIAVLFPKAVIGFHKKVRLWFPDWSQDQVNSYNQWFLDQYMAICAAARTANCNVLVKLHPSSYAAYWCRTEEEYDYWNRHPWIKILKAEHTHAMFRHADVGLGINTHSAMDMAYFGKPFIYVDSDGAQPPSLPGFSLQDNPCTLTPGPSSHWHTTPLTNVNPWFPSWIGWFAHVDNLAKLLADPATYQVDQDDLKVFIEEFWYKNDGKASARVVDFVLHYSATALNSWQLQGSLRRWRGWVVDLYHFLSSHRTR